MLVRIRPPRDELNQRWIVETPVRERNFKGEFRDEATGLQWRVNLMELEAYWKFDDGTTRSKVRHVWRLQDAAAATRPANVA